ncbi:putative bifunctional diguanylate cyclase/phosphodiesterase [Rhodanobacter aciditrophus]|uniref:Bifunctional diguanylate cyclase/phosphodiesterase n=1 Tax=Rhodanobacter aciditrophus TaxID=1623218 RepID=A0ABW4AWE1_9GAMM
MGRLFALFRSHLSARFVLFTLILLLIVQAVGFFVVRATLDQQVREEANRALTVAERVWQQQMIQSRDRLKEGAEVLSADFGFRAAVSSQDEKTISSALLNSAERIDASIAIMVDSRWNLKASSNLGVLSSTNLGFLIQRLGQSMEAGDASNLIAMYDGEPTQFVLAPIRAPRVIGYVLLGFTIKADRIQAASELSGVDIVLLAKEANQDAIILANKDSLSSYFANSPQAKYFLENTSTELVVEDDVFVSAIKGSEVIGGYVSMVFMESLNDARASFDRLSNQYLFVTTAGILVFALVITWLSRRVTQPLQALTEATAALEKGDFSARVSGAKRADEVGTLARSFAGMRTSISEQQAEIKKLAYFDSLTSLPNRVSFRSMVETAIEDAENTFVAVVTINLDRFKQVNDVLGYAMGDEILKATAIQLTNSAGLSPDCVARVSGDEFAIILSSSDALDAVLPTLQQSLNRPLEINETQIDLSASIGVASWPKDATDVDNLINVSQVAMYAAKARKEDLVIYHESLVTAAPENLSLLSELRRAVNQDELRVFLQPKVDTKTHKVTAAEALIRWQHPEKGMVAPYLFVPFAEQTGFVRELTKWMIREVVRQWHDLQIQDTPLRISVNLSTRDLMAPGLPEFLADTLSKFDVPASGLCLEITESAIMDDPKFAEQTLAKLSEMGFRLSIDDFGTGYSSLGYLKRLPVNELKVDQSFVFGMIENPNDKVIVRSTIDLAHNLGLDVVAEGVETEDMYHALCELGCEEAQGYLISRPIPLSEFAQWRDTWQSRQQGNRPVFS